MVSYRSLPKSSGVYFFKNARGAIIYIGKAKSLRDRVGSYFTTPNLLPKTADLVSEITSVDYILTQSEIDAFLLEANLIRKHAPKYNVSWKDGKAYPLLQITVKDKIPLVRIVRREDNPAAKYFGPYTAGTDLVSLLRTLRRIFPFVSQKHFGNKPCLRSHLGLCPCQNLKSYPANLKNLFALLSGKRQLVQKKLLKDMQEAAARQDFETASTVKSQLAKIELLTATRTAPWEYEVNPNLTSDRLQQSLLALQRLLGLPTLHKIECYDISNTSGKQASGAQVVFVDGQPEKSLYRRYKIKKTGADTDMIKEMISRRLKSKIALPELFVIDGGKEHLLPAPVPVIGLAKRLETIYYQDKVIRLPADSPALQLLQRLRDEAHRFSRRYHFLLRKRKMLT